MVLPKIYARLKPPDLFYKTTWLHNSLSVKTKSKVAIVFFISKYFVKLLFADDNVDERTFYEFMKPFDIRISNLGALDSVEAFRQDTVRVCTQCDTFSSLILIFFVACIA